MRWEALEGNRPNRQRYALPVETVDGPARFILRNWDTRDIPDPGFTQGWAVWRLTLVLDESVSPRIRARHRDYCGQWTFPGTADETFPAARSMADRWIQIWQG